MQDAQKHVAVFVQVYKPAKRGLTGDTLPCYYVATLKHGNVSSETRKTGETEDNAEDQTLDKSAGKVA